MTEPLCKFVVHTMSYTLGIQHLSIIDKAKRIHQDNQGGQGKTNKGKTRQGKLYIVMNFAIFIVPHNY